VDVVSFRPRFGKMAGKATVDGKLACEATLTCMIVPRAPESKPDAKPDSKAEAGSSEAAPASAAAQHRRQCEHPPQRGDRRRRADPGVVDHRPYCTIGRRWNWARSARSFSHVVIDGRTRVGARNTFYPFCSIGVAPQDLKYAGEPTETVIGDGNTIRECVTISRGTRAAAA